MRLLVAEDDLDLAEALTVFLEKNQYTVDAVHDGSAALDYAGTGGYDAIILDIMMPKLDGLQVLTQLQDRGVSTPVMLLTARGEKDDRVAGFNSGAEDRYMAIFLDCQRELHSVRTFAVISLLVAAACVALVYLLIWFFSKKAIEPTVKSVEKQKQFITDASHELKTPLTVIATSLKVLEMEVGQQKWIDKAQAQTEKMSELVNDLVTLARLDEEKPLVRFARFDISGLVTETADSFRDFAAARGHTLEVDAAPGLFCCGDEYAVRQLVSILLDNAVKYADDGGVIRLGLEKSKKGLVLRTSNPCAGLDEEELDKLFDRFYRPDRSRSKQTGGFGIGLSIARSIVEAHKGSIRAECPAEGVIQFVVILRE